MTTINVFLRSATMESSVSMTPPPVEKKDEARSSEPLDLVPTVDPLGVADVPFDQPVALAPLGVAEEGRDVGALEPQAGELLAPGGEEGVPTTGAVGICESLGHCVCLCDQIVRLVICCLTGLRLASGFVTNSFNGSYV